MRNYFAQKVLEIAERDESVVLLYGDIGNKLFDRFKENFPRRFFNCGVAEANMVSVAAGLAKSGFKPIVYTINSFLYLKTLEQIKLDVCYQQLPVILIGTGGGLSYSELGTTHHSLEDLGVLSQLPKIKVFAPGTISSLNETLNFVQFDSKPAYIRIGKKEDFDPKFIIHGQSNNYLGMFEVEPSELRSNLAILSVGTIVENVTLAVAQVRSRGCIADHFHISQISPISPLDLKYLFVSYDNLIVVEEHYPNGGLYSQLCILKSILDSPVKINRLGPRHDYFVGLGNLEEARHKLGLSTNAICDVLLQTWNSTSP
jgi:transketolase